MLSLPPRHHTPLLPALLPGAALVVVQTDHTAAVGVPVGVVSLGLQFSVVTVRLPALTSQVQRKLLPSPFQQSAWSPQGLGVQLLSSSSVAGDVSGR